MLVVLVVVLIRVVMFRNQSTHIVGSLSLGVLTFTLGQLVLWIHPLLAL